MMYHAFAIYALAVTVVRAANPHVACVNSNGIPAGYTDVSNVNTVTTIAQCEVSTQFLLSTIQ